MLSYGVRHMPARERFIALAAALVLSLVLVSGAGEAQKSKKALTKNEVIELLESGVPPARVSELAKQYGIAFEMTSETETQLLDAGATEDLLKTLRQLAPARAAPPASPPPSAGAAGAPVLLIEVTPGGAQVYVDDEPIGTTSSQGRLKLSQLAAGGHTVRVSLPGHRDHEESVELAAGRTVEVKASLEPARAAGGPVSPPVAPPRELPPSQAGTGATTPPDITATPAGGLEPGSTPGAATERAALGVVVRQPQGSQEVFVVQVRPGSPAERAGLRPGFRILGVDGRPVTSPAQLNEVISAHRPGDVVGLTYHDGSGMLTAPVRLASASSLPPPAGPPPPGVGPDVLGAAMARPAEVVSFTVAHDHGAAGSDYCVGTLGISSEMILYRSTNGVHSFELPVRAIKEAKKNAVYLMTIGGFHIRLRRGSNYNFVTLNSAGQYQPPDAVLDAIDRAMGKR